jgi:hypothetical protein
MARHGAFLGALIAAALYAGTRLNYQLLVPCLFMGMVLQGVYLATGSIFAPILLHGLSNFLAFTLDLYRGSMIALGFTAFLAIVPIGLLLFHPILQFLRGDQFGPLSPDASSNEARHGGRGLEPMEASVPYSIVCAVPLAYLPFFVLLVYYHRFS